MRILLIKIGSILKERRELLGLQQPQLASLSGVSIRTIQLIERGRANPSLETVLKLAEPLGLTLKLALKDMSKSEEP